MSARTALPRRAVVPGIVGLLLGTTAVLPLLRPAVVVHTITDHPYGATAGLAVLTLVVVAVARGVGRLARPTLGAVIRGARLVLHLWPVILLTMIYPLASHRMAGHDVGGVALTTFLLAVALTVPWLIQGVCMPLYRALTTSDDVDALRRRFCAAWPTTFVQSIPVLLVCAVPLGLVLHWSARAMGAFVLLVALDVLFAQALVLANVGRSRVAWAVAWTGYALPVLVVPTLWYLPPLLGLLTQLIPLRRHLGTRPAWLPVRDVAGDILRGLLLGSVMWADKVFYFLRSGGEFPVAMVFLALMPAVFAYNYYFIYMAPVFDASVARLRTAMQSEPLAALGDLSRAVYQDVSGTVRRTALLGAVCVSVSSWILATAVPELTALIASVSVASWLFTMITVLCYNVDYVGERLPGQILGVVHVATCAVAFVLLPLGSSAYFTMIAVELVVLAAVFMVFRRVFRTPEYTVFWQHALAW